MIKVVDDDYTWYWHFVRLSPIGENVEKFNWSDGFRGDNPAVLAKEYGLSFA